MKQFANPEHSQRVDVQPQNTTSSLRDMLGVAEKLDAVIPTPILF